MSSSAALGESRGRVVVVGVGSGDVLDASKSSTGL